MQFFLRVLIAIGLLPALLLGGAWMRNEQVMATATPVTNVTGELWQGAVNLSQSGSAKRPLLALETNGVAHAVWWDVYDGPSYANTIEDGWSKSVPIQFIRWRGEIGQRVEPPQSWRLVGDSGSGIYLFWMDGNQQLWSARYLRQAETQWTIPHLVAEKPLAWDAVVDRSGGLHVAYVQGADTYAAPAGVYYVHSWTGESWQDPLTIETSRYYRTQAESDAHIALAASPDGRLLIAWQDAYTGATKLATSVNWGINIRVTGELAGNQVDGRSLSPRHARPLPLSDGSFLIVWEAGGSCSLYQQFVDVDALRIANQIRPTPSVTESTQTQNTAIVATSTPAPTLTATATATATAKSSPTLAATLTPTRMAGPSGISAPVRVLEKLNSCLGEMEPTLLNDGRLVVLARPAGNPDASAMILTWDGRAWEQPFTPTVSFNSPQDGRPINLSCLDFAISDEKVMAIGCDSRGDAWAVRSSLTLKDLIPAQAAVWDQPMLLYSDPGVLDADPALAMDGDGRLHVLWSSGRQELVHVRSQGDGWTLASTIRKAEVNERLNYPALTYAADGRMYLAWTGGSDGRLLSARAYPRDAGSSAGWSEALPVLTGERAIGGWPAWSTTSKGGLVLVYCVALNEGRGVYALQADLPGAAWGAPVQFDDAGGAAMVRDLQLERGSDGVLYAVWVRAGLPPDSVAKGVYFAASPDDGKTWTAPVQVGIEGADMPRLIGAENGQLHLTWLLKNEIWHQYSLDGGGRWSQPQRIGGLRQPARRVSLVADGRGSVYLVALERQSEGAAAVTLLRWDGQNWVERNQVSLNADYLETGGVDAMVLPNGRLTVVYVASTGLGVVSRALPEGVNVVSVATFTPQPTLTQTATPILFVTPSPVATADLGTTTGTNRVLDVRLWIVLSGMALVVFVSVMNLLRQRKGG